MNKKKILIVSIFATLFIVSMPFISAFGTTLVTAPSTKTKPTVTAEQAIAEAKTAANTLLQKMVETQKLKLFV